MTPHGTELEPDYREAADANGSVGKEVAGEDEAEGASASQRAKRLAQDR